MKILSNIYSSSLTSPVFKGLWAEPQNDTVVDSDFIYSHTDEFYYPFKDETNEQINNVVKTNSKSLITSFGEIAGNIVYFTTFVNVDKTLPFTEEEFKNYKLGKYNKDKDIFQKELIENTLDVNGLEKYKNSDEHKKKTNTGIKGFFKKIFKR